MVLWMTSMPSVLVEIGYLSNTKEEKELNDEKVQDYLASAIYRAFKEYKTEVESIN
jgi:N-acetylmuramoyl-L-alanine amidase